VPAAAAAATAAGAATATAPGAPGGTPPAQPTTALPAANGSAAAAAGTATATAARPGEPLRVPGAAATPPGTARTNYGPDDDDDEPRSRMAIFGAIAAALVVVAVLVVLLTGVLGGGGSPTQKANTIGTPGAATSPSSGSSAKKAATPSATPKPGTYTVAVLNGTTVPGLARGVANRLQNTKYKIGNVTNAATQDRSATLVEFAPGHRAEADSVAKAIEVGSDAIQPLSPGSKTIAGNLATVVVTVGADQNTSPQQQTATTP
jgi:hypothetical protein